MPTAALTGQPGTRGFRLFARTLMRMATGELHQDMSAYSYTSGTMEYFNRIARSSDYGRIIR